MEGAPLGDGFGFGLLVAAFWFGFRHGIDFDHIAAITDITSSTEERRRAIAYGTLYALGHGLVVLGLGVLAILGGDLLPANVDEAMTRIVGVTLLALGVYVVVSLVRHGRDFRLRSRWMLIFSGVRRGARWARRRLRPAEGELAAPASVAVDEPPDPETSPELFHHGHHGRPGHHHHRGEPHDVQMSYGPGAALGVGMIHGVGAETPTQVLIFLAAAGAGGRAVGVVVLATFIVGLLASNTVITVGSAVGFLRAQRNFPVYAAVAVLTAGFSLFIGTLFVLGRTDVLPALFA